MKCFYVVFKINKIFETMRTFLLVVTSLMDPSYMELEVVLYIGLVAASITIKFSRIPMSMHCLPVFTQIPFGHKLLANITFLLL